MSRTLAVLFVMSGLAASGAAIYWCTPPVGRDGPVKQNERDAEALRGVRTLDEAVAVLGQPLDSTPTDPRYSSPPLTSLAQLEYCADAVWRDEFGYVTVRYARETKRIVSWGFVNLSGR